MPSALQTPASIHFPDTPPPAAIVLGAEDFNALAVIRALSRAGVPVIAASPDPRALGFHSRYPAGRLHHEDPVADPGSLVTALLEFAGRSTTGESKPMLFPTSDRYVGFLSEHRDSLAPHFTIHLPPADLIERILSKDEQYQESEIEGIPYPRTWTRASRADLHAQLDSGTLEFPLLLKASAVLADPSLNRIFRRIELPDRAALTRIEATADEHAVEYVMQEIIPGDDDQLYTLGTAITKTGEVTGIFTGRKLRQMPPKFGICRAGESIDEPRIVDLGVRLLRRFHYFGVSQVEFKYDARDDRFKLMEINPRTWAWVAIAEAVGVNLAFHHYLDAFGKTPVFASQGPGRTLWFGLYDDIRYSWRHRDHWPLTYLFKGYERIVESRFEWSDPKPALHYWFTELTRPVAGAVRRLRRGPGMGKKAE
jgi:D-aspartate ligase